MRDLLQAIPEIIFKADAGLVTIDRDRAPGDCGFHNAPASLGELIMMAGNKAVKAWRSMLRWPQPPELSHGVPLRRG